MTIESEHDMFSGIRGQVAMVTGASRGLGRVYAEKLARLGARVVLLARSLQDLYQVADGIRAEGGEAMCVQADVTDRRSVARAFNRLDQHSGHIDLLINNAGNLGATGALWEVDADEWWNTVVLHLLGGFHAMQEALQRMVPSHHGRIINLVSHAGAYRWPKVSAYSVAKAAMIKLTENAAVEARQHGVVLFAFHPGLVRGVGLAQAEIRAGRTEPAEAVPESLRDIREWFVSQMGSDRAVTVDRGADTLARLASGHYDFLTGRYVTVYDDLDELSSKAGQIGKGDAMMMRILPLLEVPELSMPPIGHRPAFEMLEAPV